MRARNIKPGLFKNEDLGSSDPLLTILFEGLWCMADREGRLECRPLLISSLVFPYRRVSTKKLEAMLDWLEARNFIKKYGTDQVRYIQVLEFLKHQRPHSKETPSHIPPLTSLSHQPRSGEGENGVKPKSVENALIPDSGSLDSGSLIPDTPLRGVRTQGGAPAAGGGGIGNRSKSLEEREAELRAQGFDSLALPGEPGYCGNG